MALNFYSILNNNRFKRIGYDPKLFTSSILERYFGYKYKLIPVKNNLVDIIHENINLLKELDNSIDFTFKNDFDKIILESDKEQISRVFLNLIKNSIESINQKAQNNNNFSKKITIELSQDDSHIKSTIEDNGIGFNKLKDNIKNILNPYFTTKKNGTGLGLSIVNKIINDHNGKIDFIPIQNGAKINIIFLK